MENIFVAYHETCRASDLFKKTIHYFHGSCNEFLFLFRQNDEIREISAEGFSASLPVNSGGQRIGGIAAGHLGAGFFAHLRLALFS